MRNETKEYLLASQGDDHAIPHVQIIWFAASPALPPESAEKLSGSICCGI